MDTIKTSRGSGEYNIQKWHDAIAGNEWFLKNVYEKAVKLSGILPRQNARVADLGCGSGSVLRFLPAGNSSFGIDLSGDSIKAAIEILKNQNPSLELLNNFGLKELKEKISQPGLFLYRGDYNLDPFLNRFRGFFNYIFLIFPASLLPREQKSVEQFETNLSDAGILSLRSLFYVLLVAGSAIKLLEKGGKLIVCSYGDLPSESSQPDLLYQKRGAIERISTERIPLPSNLKAQVQSIIGFHLKNFSNSGIRISIYKKIREVEDTKESNSLYEGAKLFRVLFPKSHTLYVDESGVLMVGKKHRRHIAVHIPGLLDEGKD